MNAAFSELLPLVTEDGLGGTVSLIFSVSLAASTNPLGMDKKAMTPVRMSR
ncbi:hypothetical protein D1872_335480 [compost metagenome]